MPSADPSEHPERNLPASRHAQLLGAVRALTCLTIEPRRDAPPQDMAASVWAFPIVGGTLGLLAGMIFIAGTRLGLGINTALIIAFLFPLLLTCARHERGLIKLAQGAADADAKEDDDPVLRLNGLLALTFVMALRWAAVSELAGELIAVAEDFEANVGYGAAVTIAFTVAGAASRTLLAWVWFYPLHRQERAATHAAGRIQSLAIATAVAAAFSLLLLSFKLFVAITVMLALLYLILASLGRRFALAGNVHLGDASQLAAEIVVLLALSVMAVPI